MNFRLSLTFALIALAVSSPMLCAAANVRVTDLRCEYLLDPLGIDEEQPQLSWRIESDTPGQKQTAYQVLEDRVMERTLELSQVNAKLEAQIEERRLFP